MDTPFHPHAVTWTRENSSRWWNAVSALPASESQYFSRQAGDSLLNFLGARGVPLQGRVVDFGCGPGYLLDKLVTRNVACEGADFSPDSLEMVTKRLAGNPSFRGVTLLRSLPSELPGGAFDTLFLVETIEHLLDDDLEPTIRELHRVLKPGGTVIVTTPNNEDLEESKVICPDCGCIFHKVQHVRAWVPDTLSRFMATHGFETIHCLAVYLQPTRLRRLLAGWVCRVIGKKLPHLVYVGARRA